MTLAEQSIEILKRLSECRPGHDDPIWQDIDDLAKKLQKKPTPPTDAERHVFNEFRKRYSKLGSVKGLDRELAVFLKHKDWREVLVNLDTNIDRQIAERSLMLDAGKHVPDWPHLSTYLGPQRRWEMVYYHGPSSGKVREDRYTAWLRMQKYRIPYNEVLERAMSFAQFEEYTKCTGKFEGLEKRMPENKRRKFFVEMHSEYFNSLYYRKWATVTEYMLHKIKEND